MQESVALGSAAELMACAHCEMGSSSAGESRHQTELWLSVKVVEGAPYFHFICRLFLSDHVVTVV